MTKPTSDQIQNKSVLVGATLTDVLNDFSGAFDNLGDVDGPAGAVADNLAAFNLETGKVIKDSGIPLSTVLVDGDVGTTVAAFGHNHTGVYEPADATILKDADIGVTVQAYDVDIATVSASQAEMEAGTEAGLRSMSPLRVAQAIAALSPASGTDAAIAMAIALG